MRSPPSPPQAALLRAAAVIVQTSYPSLSLPRFAEVRRASQGPHSVLRRAGDCVFAVLRAVRLRYMLDLAHIGNRRIEVYCDRGWTREFDLVRLAPNRDASH